MKRPHLSVLQPMHASLLGIMLLTLTIVDKTSAASCFSDPQAQQARSAALTGNNQEKLTAGKLPEAAQRQRRSATLQTRPQATAVRSVAADPKPAAASVQSQQARIASVTGDVAPRSVTALANLTPYQPAGWSNRIVVSTVTGTHTDSGTLRTTDTLYIDWAVLNSGDATTVRFYTKLYVDGVEYGSWYTDPPLANNSYTYVEDFSLGTLGAGTHTLRLVTDALNNITESNESDNEYTRTISVVNASQPNLTPYQPTGWSDRLVVSTIPGTHADAGSLGPADTLYIDWAVLNNGSGASGVRFYTKLYVDGIERASWYTDPPLNSNAYAYVEDYNLGTLGTGVHTLRLVADALNNIAESNELDNEYTKTINVGAPNLMPFQPTGWSDRVVVSTVTGTHSDNSSLRTTDTLYVDWAVLNNGSAATGVRFYTRLYVDGVEKGSWYSDPPLSVNSYAFVEDFSLGSLNPGAHVLRLVTDALNNIAESNEFDNEYTKTISVTNTQQPNLTPFQPSGWSDRIVVSTTTGTHTDGASPTPSDILYVDWAVINNGGAATAVRFYTKLYVDGVEKGSWYTDPPLNPNSYAYIEDFSLGRLSEGAHTLRLVTDALNNVGEGNESDNEYTRTINVTVQQQCASITINVTPTGAGSINRPPENCTTLLDAELDHIAEPQAVSEQPTEVIWPDGIRRSAETTAVFRSLVAKAEAEGTVRVIVKLRTDFQPEGTISVQAVQSQRNTIAVVQDVLLERMATFGVQGVKRFKTVPYIGMVVDADGLRYLENSADVSTITEDKPLPPLLDASVPLIGAPDAWLSGFSGSGQVVAILDTGVDKNHVFLTGKVVAEGCASTNSSRAISLCPGGASTSTLSGSGLNCNTSLMPGCSHGTHVAGIVAGRSSSFSGVAKDANLIAFQVFSQFNSSSDCEGGTTPCVRSYPTDQMWALEQVLTLSNTYRIAAVNMSLGGGKYTANCDSDSLKELIDSLRSRGIATVIASGNDGYSDGLSAPGCISSAVSVGSTDSGRLGTSVDAISMFNPPDGSNSAFFLKLLAPGQPIYSSIPGGGYGYKAGTSMATPHVAGAWAVLKSKSPSASVDQILAALISTGRPVTDPRNGITKPRIQIDAALAALAGGGGGGNVLRYSSGNTVTLTAVANSGYRFVKWQRDGADYSTSPTINLQVSSSASPSLMAVFQIGSSTTISSVTIQSPKLVVISGSGFGSSPSVLVDGQDHSDYINSASDTTITMRGKLKKMGLKAGTHNVQVIGVNGYSNVYTVTVF